MALIDDIRERLIELRGEDEWKSIAVDLSQELYVAELTNDPTDFLSALGENADGFSITQSDFDDIVVEFQDEPRVVPDLSNTVYLAGKIDFRKNEHYGFSRQYGPTYFRYNQRLGKNANPNFDLEQESGVVIPNSFSKVELYFTEKRWTKNMGDVSYSFWAAREDQVYLVGSLITTNDNPYRKNVTTLNSFDFDFQPNDMILISGLNTVISRSYAFLNMTFKFT